MLRFFKSSLPAQLLVLLLLVLALSLPLLWLGLPITAAELRGLLIGERLHGGALPYRDLYDGTAPLAAAVFGGLDWLRERPVMFYRALALALLIVQALRLNLVLNRADVHPERGYVAALTYLLLGSASTDLDALSPLLLGNTFLVFALSALLPTSREGYDNRRLFRAGFLLGLAALCYLPLALFLIVGLFAVIAFAANAFRSFLLLVCGLLFPYAVVVTYFFYVGALPNFADFHLEPGLTTLSAEDGLPWAMQWKLLVLPGVVLLLALGRSFSTALGLIFQARFRQLMLVWLVVAAGVMAAGGGVAPGSLVLMLTPLGYFGLFLWQKARLRWLPEVFFLLVLASTVALRYRQLIPGLEQALHLPTEKQFSLRPDPTYARLQNQHILVLGPDRRPYLTNHLATPYLDWPLSEQDFGHLNEYAAVVRIATQVGTDPPMYIIDQLGLAPRLQRLVPGLFGRYKLVGAGGLYQLSSPAR